MSEIRVLLSETLFETLDLPPTQWCTLKFFRTCHGRCASCLMKWSLLSSETCACGDIATMSRIVDFCPINKEDVSIHRLHSAADETAVQWLINHLVHRIYNSSSCNEG